MGVPARLEGVHLSQQALLDLERSKVAPEQLLDEVAQILVVNYTHIRSLLSSPHKVRHTALTTIHCAPKEEWILRWLLKRTGLWCPGGKARISSEDSQRMRADERSWLLFLYLVYRIPCQALARILIEADFVTNLNACLREEEGAIGFIPITTDGSESTTPGPEPKNKKRKRSKSDQVQAQEHDQEPSPGLVSALRAASICAAIMRCMDLSTSDADRVSSEHVKFAFAASTEIAASVISRLLLDIVSILLQDHAEPFSSSALVEFATGLLELWESRITKDAGISEKVSYQEFTNHCLLACLAFLEVLETSGLKSKYGHVFKHVERLVALHSVLPARAEFASTKHHITESRAKDAIATSPILDVLSHISDKYSPLLYDIAARTIPRNTVRRRQNEQPWLEALFAKLTISRGDDGLRSILQVALTYKIVLPQDKLSQIAFRQLSDVKVRWPVLVQVLQVDASVFFSKSAPLMERLCDSIAASDNEEHALIRDSIVIPLVRVAAQIRELPYYVQTWHERLSQDIQDTTESSAHRGNRVWQDPGLFAAFSEVVRAIATPSFVHKILDESLEQIARSNREESAIFGALAWTAILSSIITTRAKDCLRKPDSLRQLLASTATLITNLQWPHPQRWRLWRLMRQVLAILPDDDTDDVLPLKAGGVSIGTSLKDWAHGGDESELIECFHLLISQGLTRPAKYEQALSEEFKHLAELLDIMSRPTSDLLSFGMADACLAIVLQNPTILLLTPVDKLWPVLWRYASSSRSTTSQRLFSALIACETVTSNHKLLSQCFHAIHNSVAGHDRHQSDFAYKILLSMPCQNIKRSQERTKLLKMLEDAGIGISAEEPIPMSPTKSAESSLFQEFQTRVASSGILTHPVQRLETLEAASFERLCLELDYAKLTLSAPNQHRVDELLLTLASLTSPASPTFSTMPRNGSSAIYQRLCSLTSVLLTRFRKRLGGRYHLLLPVLQGLLRCLFRPIPIPTSYKQTQIHHHQPHWLRHPDVEPLTTKSATQYTRLLTSLCDPTASSVKHSRRSAAALTDDTKKARSVAGQYMQYLVMEYARCQLRGQLPPEVKAALMPGLYSVLDVMSRELMRGMNAAMDSSSRAIFKGLYEDYQRFGKWNHN